jgi:hypothetical protein
VDLTGLGFACPLSLGLVVEKLMYVQHVMENHLFIAALRHVSDDIKSLDVESLSECGSWNQ